MTVFSADNKLVFWVSWTAGGSFDGHICDGSVWDGLAFFWSVWQISYDCVMLKKIFHLYFKYQK